MRFFLSRTHAHSALCSCVVPHPADWGLVWGHAVSTDLVRWELLPHALEPTPGGADSLACFSGCAFETVDGGVTVLYTGVKTRRQRTNAGLVCSLLPPRELPCECFMLPPSPRVSLEVSPTGRTTSLSNLLSGSLLSGTFTSESFAQDGPQSWRSIGHEQEAPTGPIGCAAELYAATVAASAEEALGFSLNDNNSIGGNGGGVPSTSLYADDAASGGFDFDAPVPSPVGIGGAMSVQPDDVAVTSELFSPRAAATAAVDASAEWLDGLAKQPFVETICGARAGAALNNRRLPRLAQLLKLASPVIAAPPPELIRQLIGWRDPFVFADSEGEEGARVWRMLVGVGIKGIGGAALIYSSSVPDGTCGWIYSGVLCDASQGCDSEDAPCDVGAMWECPTLTLFDPAGTAGGRTSMFCVSPDRPTNRVIYWVGTFSGTRFHLRTASGPHALDGGDVMYAPSVMCDTAGGGGGGGEGSGAAPPRHLLLGWLQERDAARVKAHGALSSAAEASGGRTQFGGVNYSSVAEAAAALEVAAHAGYSGCLTVPRVLTLSPDRQRIQQAPAEELRRLRGRCLGVIVAAAAAAAADPATPLPRGEPLTLFAEPPATQAHAQPHPGAQGSLHHHRKGLPPRDAPAPPPPAAAAAVDCEVRFRRGASSAVGLWRPPAVPQGAGLLLLWRWGHPGALVAVHEASLATACEVAEAATSQPCTPRGGLAHTPAPTLGLVGALAKALAVRKADGTSGAAALHQADTVALRVLYDGSCVEAFTDEGGLCPGRALATRMYRGTAAKDKHSPGAPGLVLVALGGDASVVGATAWAMGTIWE